MAADSRSRKIRPEGKKAGDAYVARRFLHRDSLLDESGMPSSGPWAKHGQKPPATHYLPIYQLQYYHCILIHFLEGNPS